MRFNYEEIISVPFQCGAVCDPAGPSFPAYTSADPKLGAMESQCIHTAAGRLGTIERNCHQDWLMGDCGVLQPAEMYRFVDEKQLK